MKETKRKGFNFYRSYYDVFNELETDKQKLQFIEALLDKQFLDIEPQNLKGLVNFAWISQYNSIDQQVKGYKSKTKDPMQGGCQGGLLRGSDTPTLQEEEKEEEKEKEQYVNSTKVEPINFDILLNYINEKTNRSFRTINKNIQAKYKARLKDGYTKKDIQTAIDNAVKSDYHKENGFKYLTPEFFSRADKIDLFSQTTEKEYVSPEQQYANNVMAEIERLKKLKQ